MFLRIFSFSKVLFFFVIVDETSIQNVCCHEQRWVFPIFSIEPHRYCVRVHIAPIVQSDAAPYLSTQPFEAAAIFAPCAKLASGFAFATVAVQGLEEVAPVHVHGTPWKHGSIFSQIMILAAAQAAAVLQPLVMTIQFHKFRKF